MQWLETWGVSTVYSTPSGGLILGVYRELWGCTPPYGGVNNSMHPALTVFCLEWVPQ